MRKYRFFYHYNKPKKAMSIHWRGACYIVKDITCLARTESKWNKGQPQLVMRGFSDDVHVVGTRGFIL